MRFRHLFGRTVQQFHSSVRNNAFAFNKHVPLTLAAATGIATTVAIYHQKWESTTPDNHIIKVQEQFHNRKQNGTLILATSAAKIDESKETTTTTPATTQTTTSNDDNTTKQHPKNEQEPPPESAVDDYSDLPEEDEPTTCVICLINRQGPCRNPWRRFEKCMKDNHSDDESEEKKNELVSNCQDASLIWLRCLDGHRLTYAVLTNRHYQPEIDAVQVRYSHATETFTDDLTPRLDLNHWYEFCEAMEDEFLDELVDDGGEKDGETADGDAKADDPTRPENFVSGYAKFNIVQESTGHEIDVAFVKDQDGTLIGFDHFGREKNEKKEEGELIFHLTPETTSITLYAVYKEPMKEEEEIKENSENENSGAGNESKSKDDEGGEVNNEVINNSVSQGKLYYTVRSTLPRKNDDDYE